MVAKSDALWVCVRGPGGHPHGLQAWRVREPVLCIRVALARWHNRVTRNKEMLLTSFIPQREQTGRPVGRTGNGENPVPRIWAAVERRWSVLWFAPSCVPPSLSSGVQKSL